jgi:hypothetical protein
MIVTTNSKNFEKQLQNIVQYSIGFLEGVQKGKRIFLQNLGEGILPIMHSYIDIEAKANPQAMHHVYEWYKTGSPMARLYDLDYTVSNMGLSVRSTFKQSKTKANTADKPFYDKAKIMENGIPIKIAPKKSNVLRFEIDGEEIFTNKPVTINNPGGTEVQGAFERAFDSFMNNYFRQSFLSASGISSYLSKPVAYKKNLASGAKMGKNVGISTGYRWISNAQIGLE